MSNFWHWIIIGFLKYMVDLVLPLFPPHEHWGVAASILTYGGELAIILLVFGGQFIDFKVLAFLVPIALLLWLWKHKGKVLKIIGFVRFLIGPF